MLPSCPRWPDGGAFTVACNNLPMHTLFKAFTVVAMGLLVAACGYGNDTPAPAPDIQTSGLAYGRSATFYIGVTSLNPGVTLSATLCTSLTPTASPNALYLGYNCTITGTGNLTLTATDTSGKEVLRQSFTVPDPQVQIQTSQGNVVVELYPMKAKLTVDNFLLYVADGFYKDTLFHRVIPNFVIQAGGYTTGPTAKAPTYPAIALQSNNGLSNLRGTLAMARTTVPDSATSQFYINLVDNPSLDYVNATSPGYAVFGKVISGQDVVDAIGAVTTQSTSGLANVPVQDITITATTRLK